MLRNRSLIVTPMPLLLSLQLSACNLPAERAVDQPLGIGTEDSGKETDKRSGFSVAHAKLYADPHGPKFEGFYANETQAISDQLIVVTYNIKEGLKTDLAGEGLRTIEEIKDADIVLLQEMDESGVDQIAQLLGLNYVYYPAFVSRSGRNVGNAILARWLLTEPHKIILPGRHPLSGQMRIAVRATVNFNGQDLHVYSIHTETYSTVPAHRKDQIAALVEDIGPGSSLVIAGGDLNTVSKRSIQRMADQFAAVGLNRASAGSGPTISKFGFSSVAADHLFARGFSIVSSGTVQYAEASDHFPVWAKVALENEGAANLRR
jgi:endonuclease/exonuclease/phosphatase family metal-dependent hydrolase